MMTQTSSVHEDTWLTLPWLASGRLAGAQRAQAEAHLQECAACREELAAQQRIAALLTAPERVSYAPGPSFRKLMERIDGEAPTATRPVRAAPRRPAAYAGLAATWRPPGLAWAATFVLAVALGLVAATGYRWSQPLYGTYTSTPRAAGDVPHIAFDRSLPVGDAEESLRAAGARVVEGPGASGIFGVAPVAEDAGGAQHGVSVQMRALAARLRADPRVR